MLPDLHRSVVIHNELKDRLKTIFGLEDDEQTLSDTLEGESDLQDALAEVVREARRAEAMADAVEAIMDANRVRKARHDARADRLRALVAWAMSETSLKKISAPDLTISFRAGKPSVVIEDETCLPSHHVTEIRSTKPNKASIKDALEAGESVTGARLSNGACGITVRAV